MNEPSDARIHPFDDDRPTLRGGFGTSVATSRLSLADVSLLDDVAACEPSPPPGPDPLVGVVVADRYRIVAPIGRGGMGVVYEVEHVRIGKLLAMKLLAGDLARDPVTVSRFKREALAASRLQSPNTVQVLDFGVWAGLSYLVMELVQGESLGRILRRGAAMSLARVCKIAVQVLGSLAEAHDKGVVHRDIKPDNVMLVRTPDGAEIAKLVDFGLAKLRDDVDEITSHGLVVGTPYYMPPEQIRGEPVDARADLYSVGALVYRLLTAEHVFDGAPLAVLSKHLHEAPAAPSARAPARDVPAAVDRVVLKALAKDPAARWTSADELRAALVAAVHGAGSASLRRLLDPERVQSIADRAAQADVATRDDVDAYERRLRR
ncbi:MAG TPA: serine/threonine-protein kinase, partial [Minicystis sp.]|nr:serine/threonine-protein kinase [Minicystis sp.]